MSSSDECDDSKDIHGFFHWNNWNPNRKPVKEKPSSESENKYVEKNKPIFRRSSVRSLLSSSKRNKQFGNWIPPNILISKSVRQASLLVKKDNPRKMNISNAVDGHNEDHSELPSCSNVTAVAVPQNNIPANTLDWKNRKELHDLINIDDKNFVWTVIDRGIFNQFKLWYNEYGNLCGNAQGKVSKAGSSCTALVIIDKPNNLRKLLSVSHSEWYSLCQGIKQAKLILKHDAYNSIEISKLNSLEKLWALLCKRRHLLPGICVSFYLNGAVRLMKEFQVVPKVIVKEIYDMQGNAIP